jgi:hypothetical protein
MRPRGCCQRPTPYEGLAADTDVEPGHDEQTECPVCKGHGGPGPLDPCPECNKYGPLWHPDPRTVAAVVEWLRGRSGAHGGGFTSADDVAAAIVREFGASE